MSAAQADHPDRVLVGMVRVVEVEPGCPLGARAGCPRRWLLGRLATITGAYTPHPGLFNALVLGWVSPKCHTLMQTAVG